MNDGGTWELFTAETCAENSSREPLEFIDSA